MADYDLKEDQNPYVLKRVRYYDTQLLIDQDFIDDQKYHMDRLRRLLRLLNSAGVVEGLAIQATGGTKVKVSTGTALDDLGRLILLGEDSTLTLTGTGTQALYISFKELESDMASAGPSPGNTRFKQAPTLAIGTTVPAHGVRLGSVTFVTSNQVTVSTDGRVFAGTRMPGPVDNSAPVLRSAGVDAAPTRASLSGDINISGSVGVGLNASTTPGARLDVVGTTTDASASALKVSNSAQAALLELKNSGSASLNGDLTISSLTASSAVFTTASKGLTSGTLPVTMGGTGNTSLTGVLKGNGNTALTAMTGTATRLTRWKDANTLDSSIITDDATAIAINGELKFTGNRSITTNRGMLIMGTNDGSQATASEVVGAIGFTGYGQSHAQFSYRVGIGFELVDRSGDGPGLNYARDSKSYTDLKLKSLTATDTVAAVKVTSSTTIAATGQLTAGSVASSGAITGASLSISGAVSGSSISSSNTITASGAISGASISSGGSISAVGSVSGASLTVSGNAVAATINTTSTIAAGGLISGPSVSVTGAATVGSLSSTGTLATTGNVTSSGLTVSGTASIGTVSATTVASTNVSASGALSGGSLSVSGAASVGSLSTSGAISAGSVSASNGSGTFKTLYLTAPPGDPAPVITARTVPANQGGATERTELILFHSNDGDNGSGPDTITLRSPMVRLQTFSDAGVGDIDNAAGSNDRLVVFPSGDVGIGYSSGPQAKLDVNGAVRADRIITTNVMRYKMYPDSPSVYDDIFSARNAGAMTRLGTSLYDDTTYTSSNLWNLRPIIKFGTNNESDGNGAKVVVPSGYDTLWVRLLGERWNVIKAYFLDGGLEQLGTWVGGFRSLNSINPDGTLSDGTCPTADYIAHQWLPIPVGRAGQVALIPKANTSAEFWVSGVAFSKNPWNHASMSAAGFYWTVNGGTATGDLQSNWNRDILSRINSGSNIELRVPVIGNGKDKLLYLVEHNNNWAGTPHSAVTINNINIERFCTGYDNPFSRHWNGKMYCRYIAARIPGSLVPAGTRWISVRIDRTKQNGDNLYFREIGTHEYDVPAQY